ncbi:mitochondrial carrier homolog 2-like [Anopheles coustani]|uniref:mitochondrial carrier homolog 2-like n=2 Tax=coustani group TaxID=59130 RepID=UPI0026595C28|nr:mitochondrial carrier homolog 2-like [Anopheles coustani]
MNEYTRHTQIEPEWFNKFDRGQEWVNKNKRYDPLRDVYIYNEVGNNSNESNETSTALKVGFRVCCMTALQHPLDYAKTLIQLGYEPIAPRLGRTLFGARRMMLPNIFQYVYHIGTVDGFTGCFRGLSAKLVGNVLSSFYGEKLAIGLGLVASEEKRKHREENDFIWFVSNVQSHVAVHFAGIVISQPFHVISTRMMAQFVGREQLYSGLWQSVKVIWQTEGITGFFSGFVPRLIVELGCIVIPSTITYLFCRYIEQSRTLRKSVNSIAQITVKSWLYPYHVVSTCMIVTGSRLKAGNPLLMDNFFEWSDCYDHKRGLSLFFRKAPSFGWWFHIHDIHPIFENCSRARRLITLDT